MSEPYADWMEQRATHLDADDDVPQEELPTDEDLSDIVRRHKEEDCEECHGEGQVPVSELAKILGTTRTHWVCLTCGGTRKAPRLELAEVLETLHVEQRDWEQQYNWRMAS